MKNESENPVVWAIRMTRRANSDRAAAWFYFAETANEEIAKDWRQGLDTEIAKLAQLPARWPIAEEDNLTMRRRSRLSMSAMPRRSP